VHLIVNPAAAGGRLGRDWPGLSESLAAAGFAPPVTFTKAPGHATEIAAQLVSNGTDVVAVAGGDGTICEAIEGMHAAGRGILAILPLGTGNDAARTLGLPLKLAEAAQVALNGGRRRVDLMRIGDRVVFNAIGIGLLGDINLRAARIKKVRGIAAYLVAATGSLFGYAAPRVEVETGDDAYEGSMLILAVHCGPTTGGGFRLAPEAVCDDGVLDATLVENVPVAARLHRLATALAGTLPSQRGSHPLRFTRMTLRTDTPLPAHLDGNPWRVEPPGVDIEVLPRALEIVAGGPSEP